MSVFAIENGVYVVVLIALLAVSIFAFVNSLLWSAESYQAAGKLTKPTWNIILGIGVLLQLLPIGIPLGGLISIALLIAALVYLVDVRPALASLRRR